MYQNKIVKPVRKTRDDGKETQAAIIETAGKLIASQGYDKTTSKQICQELGINLAAVNYHFDSREKLYLEVLRQVYTYLLSVTELNELEEKNLTAEQKIEKLLNLLEESVKQESNWKIRVWLREILSPSDFVKKIVTEEVLPKLNLMTKIFSEYTGLPANDSKTFALMIGTFAPFFWMLLFQREEVSAIRAAIPINYEKEKILEGIKNFVMTSLKQFKL